MSKRKPMKPIAILTLHKVDRMTPELRKQLATWLRQHARSVSQCGDDYCPRFTGRFYR